MAVASSANNIWSQLTTQQKASVAQTGEICSYFTPPRSITSLRKHLMHAGGRPDAHLYFVGPHGSGKSTLLNRYIQPDRVSGLLAQSELHKCHFMQYRFLTLQADTPKSTDGLEYTYIRKPVSRISDRKELAHLWEVSGTSELPQEIFGIRNILAPEQVKGEFSSTPANLFCLSKLDSLLLICPHYAGCDGCHCCGSRPLTARRRTEECCVMASAYPDKTSRCL